MLLRVVYTNGDIVRDISDPVLHCTIAHFSVMGRDPAREEVCEKIGFFVADGNIWNISLFKVIWVKLRKIQ